MENLVQAFYVGQFSRNLTKFAVTAANLSIVDGFLAVHGQLTERVRQLVTAGDSTMLASMVEHSFGRKGKAGVDCIGAIIRRVADQSTKSVRISKIRGSEGRYSVELTDKVPSAPKVVSAKGKTDAPDGASIVANDGLRGEKPDAEEQPLPSKEALALQACNLLMAEGLAHLPKTALDNLARAIVQESQRRVKEASTKIAAMNRKTGT